MTVTDRTRENRRPKLTDAVESRDFCTRWGRRYTVMTHPDHMMPYRFEPLEAELIRLMDGTRTMAELETVYADMAGESDADLTELFAVLRDGHLLTGEEPVAPPTAERRASRIAASMRRFYATLSIDWRGAHRLVGFMYRAGFRHVFRRRAVAVCAIVATCGLAAFVALARPGHYHLAPATPGVQVGVIIALNLVIIFFHEAAHALVIVHHGRRVKSAGFRIYFGAPAFFVDSSDAVMLDRRDRILQAFAGPFAELVLAAPFALYVWRFPHAAGTATLYKWVVLNYLVALMNLVPFLELDGYWIFSDLIEVPDLRRRALSFVRHDSWRRVLNGDTWSKSDVGLLVYGIAASLYAIASIGISLFFWRRLFFPVVAALWSAGPAGRIALVSTVMALAGPLMANVVKLGRAALGSLRRFNNRLRFRIERRWRVDAARSLDERGLGDLSHEALCILAGVARRRSYAAGEPVEHDPGSYVLVRRGSLETGGDGAVRVATATRPTVVYEFDREVLDPLLEPARQLSDANVPYSMAPAGS